MRNLSGGQQTPVFSPWRIPIAAECFASSDCCHYYRSTYMTKTMILMPKLRLIAITLLTLTASTIAHADEKRYVSDELNTWVRSGPGDNYRLAGSLNAGEEVTLLQTNDNTQYGQVRDSNGRTAWIPAERADCHPKPTYSRTGPGKSGQNADRQAQ
ncbi:SH3 domain-containing protein [Kluyvera cryocrescens]|uniref:SH3 domain-containing protein n=1 Tax=Kluyvera cryocrescens TaxID=580 RepID=A0A485AG80_KLUCR|nr:SH3 domain-containing protein [Kluyvera cryocrescens]